MEATGEMTTSSSLVASRSRVNRTPLQENEKAKKMTVTSGRRCLEQYGRFNRPTSWGKMFPVLLIGQKGWFSRKCKLIWKLRGTKSSRLYFQLAVSTLPIKEKGFGLLPTITNSMVTEQDFVQAKYHSSKRPKYKDSLLPTPDCSDRRSDNSHQWGLTNFAKNGLLPTPQADDNPAKNTGKRNQDSLQKRAYQETGQTSQLNPRFVAEMMGFPPDYLELPFLSGETNQ